MRGDGRTDSSTYGCTYRGTDRHADSSTYRCSYCSTYRCTHRFTYGSSHGFAYGWTYGCAYTNTYRCTDRCANRCAHSGTDHTPLRCGYSLLLAQHSERRSECQLYCHSRRRLCLRVSWWLCTAEGALHTCGIRSVSGAAAFVRGDGCTDGCTYRCTDGGTDRCTH